MSPRRFALAGIFFPRHKYQACQNVTHLQETKDRPLK